MVFNFLVLNIIWQLGYPTNSSIKTAHKMPVFRLQVPEIGLEGKPTTITNKKIKKKKNSKFRKMKFEKHFCSKCNKCLRKYILVRAVDLAICPNLQTSCANVYSLTFIVTINILIRPTIVL